MKTQVVTLITVIGLLWACNPEQTQDEASLIGAVEMAITGVDPSSDDETGVLFEVFRMNGEKVYEKYVPFLEKPYPGEGGKHEFASTFVMLPPEEYRVKATVMKDESTPSSICKPAETTVIVKAGQTSKVILVVSCQEECGGAIIIDSYLNHCPIIKDVALEPGPYINQCEEMKITVGGEDIDEDKIEYLFKVISEPEGAQYKFTFEGNTAKFSSETAGDFEISVQVKDKHCMGCKITFPVYVFLDDQDGDGKGDKCPCNEGLPCDDKDLCTINDFCKEGVCFGEPVSCDDNNVCTDDSCDKAVGCVHQPNNNPCDDGNACTAGDTCENNTCKSGKVISCDDGNLCTDDACDPVIGCTHAFNNIPCDDGNPCTINDTCQMGKCVGIPKPEICNGIDDDCDGEIDEPDSMGCTIFYRDQDGDNWGVDADKKCLCNPIPPYTVMVGGDCNDQDVTIHPAAPEVCDGKDNNCDLIIDPEGSLGCKTFYHDGDADGWGFSGNFKCLCGPSGTYTAIQGGDCNDQDVSIHPAAPEVCDGKDNNCDLIIDPEGSPGCKTFYYDGDGDGWGVSGNTKCLCAPSGKYTATKQGDCDDGDKNYAEMFEFTVPDKIVQKYWGCDNKNLIPRPWDFATVDWTNSHAGFDIVFTAPKGGNVRVWAYGELDGSEQPDESLRMTFNGGASLVWYDNIQGGPGWYWIPMPGSVNINGGKNKIEFRHPNTCNGYEGGSVHFGGQGKVRVCYHN